MNLADSNDVLNRGGGAIRGYGSNSLVWLRSCQFWNNFAVYNGGAIFSDNSVLHLLYSSFVENEAKVGGAIYSTGNRVHAGSRNVFASNIAQSMAPVMYFEPNVVPYLTGRLPDLACDNESVLFECNGAFDSETNECTTFVECDSPTSKPSHAPTMSIMPSAKPSSNPTQSPTRSPAPSDLPSGLPSSLPTEAPSSSPTSRPSSTPSLRPTKLPTIYPSMAPSLSPTMMASSNPTSVVSKSPSQSPSSVPSAHPTYLPSMAHSIVPSLSLRPSVNPSLAQSKSPSLHPTTQDSNVPSLAPSDVQSSVPSLRKSGTPTKLPSQGGM